GARLAAQEADRGLDVLDRCREFGFAAQSIIDRGDDITARRQVREDTRPVAECPRLTCIAARPAAAMDPDDQRPRFRPGAVGVEIEVELERTITDIISIFDMAARDDPTGIARLD